MKRVKLFIAAISVGLFGAVAVASVPVASTHALTLSNNALDSACQGNADSQACSSKGDDANKLIGTLVNTLLFVVGALAVIMIIVGGIFYVISNGDAGKVARAKNTLTYAIVGLVVAFVAYAIVNWVLKLF